MLTQYSGRGIEMEKTDMETTMEVMEEQGQEIETKLGCFKKMKEDGREMEAFQLQAELALQGIWVGDI